MMNLLDKYSPEQQLNRVVIILAIYHLIDFAAALYFLPQAIGVLGVFHSIFVAPMILGIYFRQKWSVYGYIFIIVVTLVAVSAIEGELHISGSLLALGLWYVYIKKLRVYF